MESKIGCRKHDAKETPTSMTELPPSNLPFLFAAFAVVWVVFFIYAAYLSWRRQSAQRDMDELRDSTANEQRPDRQDSP